MAHEIETHEEFLEVSLSGQTSKYEILQIIGELARRDPGKELADLWILATDSQVPLPDLIEIAETIKKRLPPESRGRKTAFVATDAFQKAQLQLYVAEASVLGLDMRIFPSRDEAVTWIHQADN